MLMVKTSFGISFIRSLALPTLSVTASLGLVKLSSRIFDNIGLQFISENVYFGILLSIAYYLLFLKLTGAFKNQKNANENKEIFSFKSAVTPKTQKIFYKSKA